MARSLPWLHARSARSSRRDAEKPASGQLRAFHPPQTDVMIVYDLLEDARNGAARALVRAPNKISAPDVKEVADAFLDAVSLCARCSAEIANRRPVT
jgi:hypothetical protein